MRVILLPLDGSLARHTAKNKRMGVFDADGWQTFNHESIIYLMPNIIHPPIERYAEKILKNIGFMVLLGTVGFFSCGMGGVFEHREELGTLKDQGEEEAGKEKELAAQDASFQNVKAAIVRGELKEGMPGRDLVSKLGPPAVTIPKDEGHEWLYIARSKKWLDSPRVALYFDKDGRLKGWECTHTNCK